MSIIFNLLDTTLNCHYQFLWGNVYLTVRYGEKTWFTWNFITHWNSNNEISNRSHCMCWSGGQSICAFGKHFSFGLKWKRSWNSDRWRMSGLFCSWNCNILNSVFLCILIWRREKRKICSSFLTCHMRWWPKEKKKKKTCVEAAIHKWQLYLLYSSTHVLGPRSQSLLNSWL